MFATRYSDKKHDRRRNFKTCSIKAKERNEYIRGQEGNDLYK